MPIPENKTYGKGQFWTRNIWNVTVLKVTNLKNKIQEREILEKDNSQTEHFWKERKRPETNTSEKGHFQKERNRTLLKRNNLTKHKSQKEKFEKGQPGQHGQQNGPGRPTRAGQHGPLTRSGKHGLVITVQFWTWGGGRAILVYTLLCSVAT